VQSRREADLTAIFARHHHRLVVFSSIRAVTV
jgi:hypothetical protein